jgi:hypothetical protein
MVVCRKRSDDLEGSRQDAHDTVGAAQEDVLGPGTDAGDTILAYLSAEDSRGGPGNGHRRGQFHLLRAGLSRRLRRS